MVITDYATRYRYVIFLKSKDEASPKLNEFVEGLINNTGILFPKAKTVISTGFMILALERSGYVEILCFGRATLILTTPLLLRIPPTFHNTTASTLINRNASLIQLRLPLLSKCLHRIV